MTTTTAILFGTLAIIGGLTIIFGLAWIINETIQDRYGR
jgi:hypothetical protein